MLSGGFRAQTTRVGSGTVDRDRLPDGDTPTGGDDVVDESLTDALTWQGDEERGLEAPIRRRAKLTAADAADGHAGDLLDDDEVDDATGTSASALVLTGVLAGISLIWVLGWVSVIGGSTITFTDLLGEILYQFGEFLAIASPAIWFGAVLVLGRDRPAATRIRWHALGLIATAPWPILIGAIS